MKNFAQSIVETVRHPLLILDGALRVETANSPYYRTFHLTPAETEGCPFFELQSCRWDRPELRLLLEQIIPYDGSFADFKVTGDFPGLGPRVMVLNGRRVERSNEGPPVILLAIEDITETKRVEALLARDALILGNVQDSVIVTDLQGVVTYWNEGATRLFGWAAEEMLGCPLIKRFPEPVREWIAQEIRSRAEGAEWNGEFEDFRKDGSRVWIHARVTRLHDAAGEQIGILGISHDITKRKQAEEAQRQREAEYRALAENLPQLVWIADAEGETQYLNPRWVEFTGITLEGTQGWRWTEAIHPDDLPHTLERWRAALRTGADYETEYRLRRRDGRYRWHLIRGVPVRDGGGAIVRWIGTCMDVEEQKQELLAQAELAAIVEASDDMIVSTTLEGAI